MNILFKSQIFAFINFSDNTIIATDGTYKYKFSFTEDILFLDPKFYYLELAKYSVHDLIKMTWLPKFDDPNLKQNVIWFPYQKFFRSDKEPDRMFHNLQMLSKKAPNLSFEPYNFDKSYLGQDYKDNLYDKKYLRILHDATTHLNIDVLSDFFIEDIRHQARRIDQPMSIAAAFTNEQFLTTFYNKIIAAKINILTPAVLREALYNYGLQEVNTFKPTWAVKLLQVVLKTIKLENKKWLDISAGWGDRLLTAMALKMEYLGFDPNIDLKPGHDAMINKFNHYEKQKIIYLPFESKDTIIPDDYYDVILSSPPYFNLEIYNEGQAGQSINNYPTKDLWFENFMFPSLQKAWKALKSNGYLILHLSDSRKANVILCDRTNNYIKNNLINSHYQGVIGLETGFHVFTGAKSVSRPVWVWRKK